MVEITVFGGCDTPGKRAGGLEGGHVSADLFRGPSGQRVYVSRVAVLIDQGDLMVRLGLGFDDVACGVRGDRAEPSDFAWFGSAVEDGDRHVYVDQSPAPVGGVASQQHVRGDIGTELVVGASGPVFFLQ
jgi:hypothetical protein